MNAENKTGKIRNVCLISHGGAGKTTLTEMNLFNAGVIKEIGNIERGNTQSDFTPEEKKYQYSINNSYFSFNYQNKSINWIDTPGYADFKGEVASALGLIDGTVLLIDGTAGIEVNTNYVWAMAEEKELPRFVFINKMDLEGANFAKVLADIKNTFNGTFVPLTIPYGEGANFQGVIDLLAEKAWLAKDGQESQTDIPEEVAEEVNNYRTELVESIVELDDELMLKYLEDEKITGDELVKALINGVTQGEIFPVLVGSALNNSGLKALMNYLLKLIPAPDYKGVCTGSYEEEEIEVKIDENEPFVGLICKTMVDPYLGKLSIFKVHSGTLSSGMEVIIPRDREKVRIGKLYKLNGKDQETVDKLIAGDIGAVAKLDQLETSDTISDTDINIELAEIKFPQPMLIQKAQPASKGDEEKMSTSLHRISQEDPTFKVKYNGVTKELLVTAMGTVHLEIIKAILKRKFDVSFVTEVPKVAYKETIQTKVTVEEKYKKQSGGRGQYGHVFLRIEPVGRGKGFTFNEEIFGGSIPNQYIPGVEKGVVEAMDKGVLAGYPVVDISVTVYDGSYHDVDSSEMAFKIAASKALKKGLSDAKPVILEPIMNVEVIVPEEYMGDIIGDLNARRGKIQGMDPGDGVQIIKAQAPQSELFTYATDLKSITGGHGQFTMEFAYYEKVSGRILDDIIKNSQED